MALAWLLHQGDAVVLIPGTKRRRWLEENIAAASIDLSEAELARIETVIAESGVAGDCYPDVRSVRG